MTNWNGLELPESYFHDDDVYIINGDCFEVLPQIPDNLIDLILCDLPYHETGNKWDSLIDLPELWKQYERLIPNTGAITLTGTFQFGTKLMGYANHLYKYEWVWVKDNGTNAPNVNLQPFRVHEFVFVFGKGRVTNGTRTPMLYNPQKTEGKPYKQKSGRVSENWKGGLRNIITDNRDGKRHPVSVQLFNRDRNKLHPTQKPEALFSYLIKTYTNANSIVLDNCLGSGTTAVCARKDNRKCIGIEISEEYCELATVRYLRSVNEQ